MVSPVGWRAKVPAVIRPYTEAAPLAAFFLGISSAFPFTMIASTLTTRLAQAGIDKKSVTAFALAFLVYNVKFLWAPIVDRMHLPLLHRLGQRVSWMLVAGVLSIAAVLLLGGLDPAAHLGQVAVAAVLVGVAGATYDIVIDGYRIELLEPRQLGVGSGMSQYGWRIGSAAAGALALVMAVRIGWTGAYWLCALFGLPAIITALVMGEPTRRREPAKQRGLAEMVDAFVGPLSEFFRREGAALILVFVLLHKIGDTLANLTLRLLFDDLGFTNDQIAVFDVGVGFWALLAGVFVGGIIYSKLGLKRSVMISLVLMGVTNIGFALLAASGPSNIGMAAAIGFENFASGIGGVTVVAYLSALTDLRFTATQYALLSATASIAGRLITGTTAGALIEAMGYPAFYLFTALLALPGIAIFWMMMRSGLIDRSIGDAGEVQSGS
ncbi:AmpG family muropeptide MFS transporter [Sphingomonas quercus]|uniref:MFS transporter n=1 Tax=Sphingomonas quercus TaxID=2842451 RepID=A0ABS6BP48_9SPHN|nr:MFS transporter [Sphingomonas quercus]MBU3079432.1 MFS transporter [Sphingomonas quercus]